MAVQDVTDGIWSSNKGVKGATRIISIGVKGGERGSRILQTLNPFTNVYIDVLRSHVSPQLSIT
jgi:hypothetical protein